MAWTHFNTGRRPAGLLPVVSLFVVAGALAAQTDQRGPTHTADDLTTFPAEPNPFYNSNLLRYVEDNLPIQNARQNDGEAQCYEELFLHARRMPAELLQRAAARNLKFYQLYGNDRGLYRGALLRVRGQLRLLRGYDPPLNLKDDAQGLTIMYEAWIFDADDAGHNPWCVVVSELPSGLEPFEAKKNDRDFPHVEAEAFFFKRYRYGARDPSQPSGREVLRDAPFLIGKTLRVAPAPVVASGGSLWDVPTSVLLGTMGLVGLAVAITGGIWLWFRRDDAQARERLRRARMVPFAPDD